MKKLLTILLSAVLLALCGCAAGGVQSEGTAYGLYFMAEDLKDHAGGSALQTETVYMPKGLSTQELAQTLMKELLRGPLHEGLSSTIPSSVNLESVEIRGSQAVVDLSSAYRLLSGIRLTLADYAITLTLTQIPEILSVRVTVQGQDLMYRDRQTFTIRDVLLAPQGDVVSTVKAFLYFPDEKGVLTAEARTVELYEGDTPMSALARELEEGPENRSLTAVVPAGFRLKSVWEENGVCYANISSTMLDEMPEDTQLSTVIRALGMSLCSLEVVEEVWFLVDGEFVPRYGGVVIQGPFTD